MNRLSKIIFLAVFSTQTHANLVDFDEFLLDVNTGLDWLDITASAGMTYNEVLSEQGPGGLFEGWRYATLPDFNQLVIDTGTPNHPGLEQIEEVHHPDRYIPDLIEMLAGDGYQGASGMLASVPDLYHPAPWIGITRVAMLIDISDISIVMDKSVANFYYGLDKPGSSWLVREAIPNVPEPSTLILLGSGIIGIGIARIRSKT